MINSARHKYFDLGCALPDNQHLVLYQAVTDRFYLALDDLGIAQEIKKVMSSRYDLWICRIDQADNYQTNLIDNDCCMLWSLGNKQDIMVSKPFPCTVTMIEHLVPADELCEQDLTHVFDEQSYMHLVKFWMGYIHAMRGWFSWYDLEEFVSRVIVDPPQGSLFGLVKETENYILSCCYHGRDHNIVDAMILDRIYRHSELREIHELWQKNNLA